MVAPSKCGLTVSGDVCGLGLGFEILGKKSFSADFGDGPFDALVADTLSNIREAKETFEYINMHLQDKHSKVLSGNNNTLVAFPSEFTYKLPPKVPRDITDTVSYTHLRAHET